MLSIILLPLLALPIFALPSPSPVTVPRATKPYQIRGVESPIYHLYLQGLPGNKSTPVMGPEAIGEYFVIGTTIQSQNTSMYLNIGASTGPSYLPLTLEAAATTTAWGLEGDKIITETGSTYGRQLNFLACDSATTGYFDIYLQTGSNVPAGQTCSNYQTIHLPCLC